MSRSFINDPVVDPDAGAEKPGEATAGLPPPDWRAIGAEIRTRLLGEVRALVDQRRQAAGGERAAFFKPDETSCAAYESSLPFYREALTGLLGWPLNAKDLHTLKVPEGVAECVQTDDQGRIYRVRVQVLDGVHAGGLLFLPPETPPGHARWPLVIAQHGGLGSPELAAGLLGTGSANYNGLITRLRRQPVAVYAPQLPVWHHGLEPQFDQYRLDRDLRQLGGSRAALDVLMLKRSLDWLLAAQPGIDPARVGMAGLSYGGFYTLLFAALDTRIRAAVSSCFVNDRYRYNHEDMTWTGMAGRFLDVEIARLICPRPLLIEAGEKDPVFAPPAFAGIGREIARSYQALGIPENFQARLHPGGHEYDPDGAATAFLLERLEAETAV